MPIRILPYVTLDVDARLRRRIRGSADQLRLTVRSYLLVAADEVDAAGGRVRGLCDAAAQRVDAVAERLGDRIDPAGADQRAAPGPDPTRPVRLEAV